MNASDEVLTASTVAKMGPVSEEEKAQWARRFVESGRCGSLARKTALVIYRFGGGSTRREDQRLVERALRHRPFLRLSSYPRPNPHTGWQNGVCPTGRSCGAPARSHSRGTGLSSPTRSATGSRFCSGMGADFGFAPSVWRRAAFPSPSRRRRVRTCVVRSSWP